MTHNLIIPKIGDLTYDDRDMFFEHVVTKLEQDDYMIVVKTERLITHLMEHKEINNVTVLQLFKDFSEGIGISEEILLKHLEKARKENVRGQQ